MKILKARKQLLSCVLSVLLLASGSSAAFAAQPEQVVASQGGVKIEQISDTALRVTSAEGTSVLSVDENDQYRTVTITDTKTGEKEYMRYDKEANTLYSSKTGQTVQMMGALSSRSESSSATYLISYAQIKSLVGEGASLASVAGAIMSYMGIGGRVGGIMQVAGAIVTYLNSHVTASRYHGVGITVKTTKYYRHRGPMSGHVPYHTSHTITSINKY